jgi:predicted nuclease of restriction endonuclease-like RecB superfamily
MMTVRRGTSLKKYSKDKKSNLVTHSHSILVRWKNHFYQQLNVSGVKVVREVEIHTVESVVFKPNAFEMVIKKLKV